MKKVKNVVMGTAGHIDHGKTTLLKCLTGIDADRLEEEKKRGITIDIGFAPWIVPGYNIGFVDVPGHEKFVKNMLAGAGGIDGVLLVVAADEGIMPQTREHFEIAMLLGIEHGIVAITKIDLVDEEFVDLVVDEIKEMIRGSFLEGAQIVRTSAKTGEGIEDLGQALKNLADRVSDGSSFALPRLFIDRVFIMKGFGTVVTGTTMDGVFNRNDVIEVLPLGLEAKIRTIQVYEKEVEQAFPGQRTALNLAGNDLDSLKRGMLVTSKGFFNSTHIFNASFRLLSSYGKAFKTKTPVHIYHGSAELEGRIYLLDRDLLDAGGECYAQIRLEEPTVILPGDHYVVRQYSPLITMGGGVVLENHPPKFKTKFREQTIERLNRLMHGDRKSLIEIVLKNYGDSMSVSQLVDYTGCAPQEIYDIGRELSQKGNLGFINNREELLISSAIAETLKGEFLHVMKEYFYNKPLASGIKKQELRSHMSKIKDETFNFLIEQLIASGQVKLRKDGTLCFPGRTVELDEQTENIVKKMIEELFSRSFQGMGSKELVDMLRDAKPSVRETIDFLIDQREVIKVSDDYFLHPRKLDEVNEKLYNVFSEGGTFEIGEFKDLLGLTRKHAIPLLEYLDRIGITRRVGNKRQIVPKIKK